MSNQTITKLPGTVAALAAYFDHTVLKPDARRSTVETLCDEALRHGFKGVCVNPVHVARVARRLSGAKVLPVSVVGFPLGASLAASKADETKRAIQDGALEIDTVINVGAYLDGDEALVREDIAAVVRAAGKIPVKVILETAFLQREQIKELSLWSAEAGAAFVKTSTGFGPRGATTDDVVAMREALRAAGHRTEIKASGGIRTLADALAMIEAGADRIGASASVKILEEFAARG